MTQEYNVIGKVADLQMLIATFDLTVVAKFDLTDMNVMIDDEDSDHVTDWCEKRSISIKMV